jgi:arsenical pump membrane protein
VTLATAALPAALAQTWPPFVLVAGLLLIGAVAASDGLFEAVGSRLARVPGNGFVLFTALMLLVAGVTVVLNLDTAVVFLTPIVLHAARRRHVPELAFLYGVVFMSNSASLLLPGSNLTNLLVLLPEHVRGGEYARQMLPAWAPAVVLTLAVVMVWRRHDLGVKARGDIEPAPLRLGLGAAGIVAATVFMLVFTNPALPVVATGVAVTLLQVTATRRLHFGEAAHEVNAYSLGLLFVAAVTLGTVARLWGGPGRLMASAGPWAAGLIGAGAATAVNNLPAAVLLSAHPVAHPLELLVGLDLGPNLVVWGALSAVLWRRVARREGAEPSGATYTKVGAVLVPLSMGAGLLALQLSGH